MSEILNRSKIEARPMTSFIGAEVSGVDLSRPLDGDAVQEIRALLLRWRVLFFRQQHITSDQQIAFGRQFGKVTPAHPIRRGLDGKDEIYNLDLQETKEYLTGANLAASPPPRQLQVHIDNTYVINPPLGSILHGVLVPPAGGDTQWYNLVEAYNTLSPALRSMLDGLQAVHRGVDYSEFANAPSDAETPIAIHPVVRVHPETHEKSLFVNPLYTSYICGLSARESDRILQMLYEHMSRPDLAVRFRWETDSVAFWDNRATAHLGPIDIADSTLTRRMERITLTGDVPVGPDDFRSCAIVGRPFGE